MIELNAILTICSRDLLKFLRDRGRIVATFIFPVIFIGVLGGSLQANLSDAAGFDLLVFTFTGVLGQTLFQSTASGVISLIEDRENDFSKEIFVSPISRYSIIIGKILGESLVALLQGFGVILFGLIIGIDISLEQLVALIPVGVVICLLGGAFGVLVLGNLGSQRLANQIFPFIIFPQFFLSGVFNPIKELPLYLDILSRISPMRYAVDLTRNAYYINSPEYPKVVLQSVYSNLLISGVLIVVFIAIGTFLFTRSERNR